MSGLRVLNRAGSVLFHTNIHLPKPSNTARLNKHSKTQQQPSSTDYTNNSTTAKLYRIYQLYQQYHTNTASTPQLPTPITYYKMACTTFYDESATLLFGGVRYPSIPPIILPFSWYKNLELIFFLTGQQIPGVKCPKCEADGITKWVIRGKVCPNCGTECQ